MEKTWRIQRPAKLWIETVVEASTLDEALERADEQLNEGDYIEVNDIWHINFDRYWAETEDGEHYTDEDNTTRKDRK
jgi:hypothetical protein